MALVGNISGSNITNSTIGISGSVIVANRPDNLYPNLPGSDAVFFVSGNIASQPASTPNYAVRGTVVFGGDVVVSGTLFCSSSSPAIAEGDIIVRGATADQRLPIGSQDQVLKVDTSVSGKLRWAYVALAITTSGNIFEVIGSSSIISAITTTPGTIV